MLEESHNIKMPNLTEHSLPGSVFDAATELLALFPGELTPGIKFHRSRKKINGKYEVKVSKPYVNEKGETEKGKFIEKTVQIDTLLERSLVVHESALYALEHNEEHKNYLRPTAKNVPKGWVKRIFEILYPFSKTKTRKSSVKFAIRLGSVSSLREKQDTVTVNTDDILVYKNYKDIRDPQRQFSAYEGPNLYDYFNQPQRSWEETREIAILLCQYVEQEHKNGFLLNDIKPNNFTLTINQEGKKIIHCIDKKAFISASLLSSPNYNPLNILYSEGFVKATADKGKSSIEEPSRKRDGYALGKTLQWLAHWVGDQRELMLSALLFHPDIDKRLSISSFITMLEKINWHSPILMESLAEYYYSAKSSTEAESVLHEVLSFIQEKSKNNDLDPFQLEAISSLFYSPRFIETCCKKDNIRYYLEKIFAPEKGPVLVCALLGARTYLSGAKKTGAAAQALTRDFIHQVITLDDNRNLDAPSYAGEIDRSINQVIQGKSFDILEEDTYASSKKQYSRKKTFGLYQEAIHTIDKIPTEQKTGHSADISLHISLTQLKICFPRLSQKEEEAYKDIFYSRDEKDEFKCAIIQKSLEYVVSKKAGWIGKSSVTHLVKNMLAPQAVAHKEDIIKAVHVSCASYFGVCASSGKEGSRKQIFDKVINSFDQNSRH